MKEIGGRMFVKQHRVCVLVLRCCVLAPVSIAGGADHPAIGPGQSFSNPLFMMTAPNSEGWMGLTRSGSEIAFARLGASKTDSDVAAVILFRAPIATGSGGFMALIKERLEKDASLSRFEIQQQNLDLSQDRAYMCATYHALSIDHGKSSFLTKRQPLLFEMLVLYCQHPEKPGLAFAVSFSHRGLTPLPTFQAESKEFIAGVQVAQPPKSESNAQ
jgi:hypothetical protein